VRVGQMMGRDLPPEVERSRGIWNYERTMDENCLVLNVWAPALGAEPRPVLVWLHGGGLSVGSASWPLYDFTNLATRHDVVVVSINHRVGILGFLDVSHLGEQFIDSGNVGMLDIVTALEWVRSNIASFGGDSSNVTIFGESGGGSKVTCLLAMPEARGLFHNAVAMSGALLRARPPDQSRESSNVALDLISVAGEARELAAIECAKLIEAESEMYRTAGPLLGNRPRGPFGPTLGPSLPAHPLDAVRAGTAAGVNVVLGCTTHEGLLALDADIWVGGDDAVRETLRRVMPDDADRVLEIYRQAQPHASMLSLFVALASDRLMRIPHIRFAEALVQASSNAWLYLFDFRQPLVPGFEPLAGHGADMPYVVDNVELAPDAQVPGAEAVAKVMSGALVALARNGDPAHDELPPWPTYSLPERPTLIFDAVPRVDRDPMSAERQAWERLDVGAGLG
jgi:para-nitrobenzyl esterase